MDTTYWHKQEPDQPLYPDLIWSKPENKQTAGKLLIIGGNIHGFSAVGQAFSATQTAGIGMARIILPDVLQKTVSKLLPEALFAPSTPSGSFSQQALAVFLEQAAWADGVLVAGDLAHNSETAIVIEKLIDKYSGQLTFTKDSVDYFTAAPKAVAARTNTTLIVTMAQLQKLALNLSFETAFTFDMNFAPLVEALHNFTKQFQANLILKHLDTLFVVVGGHVSTTKTTLKDEDAWRVPKAAASAVWWLQYPSKTFEALTTAIQTQTI